MAIVTDISRTGIAYGHLLKNAADELYKMLVKVGLGAIVIVLVMWGLNANGARGANWTFFFLGVALFAIWSFAPTRLLIAAGAGAAIHVLKDEDLTQGAVKGITTWYQVILGIMLWFMITAAILSVIPFEGKPGNFFPIVGMLPLITVAYAAVKNRTVKALIAIFGTGVIVHSLWGLVPEDWKPFQGTEQPTTQTVGATPAVTTPTTHVAVDWGQGSGKPPVGVWSQWMKLGVGCRVSYIGGNGDVYKVRYRFYSQEWKDHEPGSFPNMSEYQFLLMKSIDEVPVKVTCQ